MQQICVLIVPRDGPSLTIAEIEAARDTLDPMASMRWLSDGEAAEFELHNPTQPVKDLVALARGAVGRDRLDVAIVPVNHRHKRLLIADMDSTMIEQECIDELADVFGIKDHVSAITERAMRGEIDFEPALRERVALLKGLHRDDIQRIAEERIRFMPGGNLLVRTMHAHGAYTALISGGFTIFTDYVAQNLGFDINQANTLNFVGDRLDGTVADPILGRDAKRVALQTIRHDRGLLREQTLAVGDGANDLAMLEAAGTGVAFRAKPAVAAAADVQIDHCDLTALLYLQGYTRAEFVC